ELRLRWVIGVCLLVMVLSAKFSRSRAAPEATARGPCQEPLAPEQRRPRLCGLVLAAMRELGGAAIHLLRALEAQANLRLARRFARLPNPAEGAVRWPRDLVAVAAFAA